MEVATFNNGVEIQKKKIIAVENIIQEYSLKQNLFDPKKISSPNLFMRKLEKRMDQYYNCLYKTFILNKK